MDQSSDTSDETEKLYNMDTDKLLELIESSNMAKKQGKNAKKNKTKKKKNKEQQAAS